jgi:hypothetical protein
MKGRNLPDINASLDSILYKLTMAHLAKLDVYVPGPIKKAGGHKDKLLARFAADPMFSIWGLDSVEYVAATLGGGTITSIHRKLGDVYQDCVNAIFSETLKVKPEQLTYSVMIKVGLGDEKRSADSYLQFDELRPEDRKRVKRWCQDELRRLTADPRVDLKGVGLEIRSCYQSADKQRSRADVALARHMMLSGVLPVMPLFCNQSNPSVIDTYRPIWVVKEGMDAYDMVKAFSGYDWFGFLKRNRDDFRKPAIEMIRKLTA